MKRILSATLAFIMGTSLLVGTALPTAAEPANPYAPVKNGCITNIKIERNRKIESEVSYLTAEVSSRVQGLDNLESIPYKVYGAIGSENTKMFVYSIGSADGLDYARATVKDIVKRFEEENPEWNALVAVNGDFFDIETSKTSSMGEPESAMIQLGNVYKSFIIPSATGRGLVGTTADGKMVYYTVGTKYAELGYGTALEYESTYSIQLFSEDRENIVAEYPATPDGSPLTSSVTVLTQDSAPADLSSTTVFVVKCETYRRSHVGINGSEAGTLGYFIEGDIVESRVGTVNDRPDEGEVYIATRSPEQYEQLKIGAYLKCQRKPSGEWADVENAIGFKVQILAEGTPFIKNAYCRNNTKGNQAETSALTEDLYDYPYCWKHRTAIGFREDGTPVLLVLKKSHHTGEYKNLGASYYEIAEQFIALGCTNAFLLDGGGSSTFVIRSGNGQFNTSFSGEGSDGRAVANAVILAVRDVPVEEPSDDLPTDPNNPAQEPNGDANTPQGGNTDAPQENNEQPSNDLFSKLALPVLAVLVAGVCATCLLIKKKKKKK